MITQSKDFKFEGIYIDASVNGFHQRVLRCLYKVVKETDKTRILSLKDNNSNIALVKRAEKRYASLN